MHKQSKNVTINASIEKCYNCICDFTSYPAWQPTIKTVKVDERDNKGRPLIVSFTLQVTIKKISYTLRYSYDDADAKKKLLSWTYVRGDIKNIQGSYLFESKGDKQTSATYSLEIELGIWAPNMILQTLKDVTMGESIKALKDRAEKN